MFQGQMYESQLVINAGLSSSTSIIAGLAAVGTGFSLLGRLRPAIDSVCVMRAVEELARALPARRLAFRQIFAVEPGLARREHHATHVEG